MQMIVKGNLKKHNPSKYSYNCLNDKNGENRTKNNVNDNPLFIVIFKSTFAELPSESLNRWILLDFNFFDYGRSKIFELGFSSHL